MDSWVLQVPTSTTIWLVFLGIGLVYAGKTLYTIVLGTNTPNVYRTFKFHATCLIYAGVFFMLLSIIAYFIGAA